MKSADASLEWMLVVLFLAIVVLLIWVHLAQ